MITDNESFSLSNMVDKTLSLSSINFISSLCSHFLSFHYSDRSPGQQPIRNSVLDVRLKRSRSIGSHFWNLVSKKVRKMTAAWYHLFVYAFLQSQRKFSIVFTARCSAVLGVVILSVCLSVCLSHAFFVTNPKNLPATFVYRMKGNPIVF